MIEPYLLNYLMLHQELNLPNLGTFSYKTTGAQLNTEKTQIQGPHIYATFSPEHTNNNDALYHFLSKTLSIPIPQAIQEIAHFTASIKKNISTNSVLDILGIGSLQQNENGNYIFIPANYFSTLFPIIDLTTMGKQKNPNNIPTTTTNATYSTTQENSWWIYAIVLTLVGVASLLFYYYYLTS